MPLTEKYQTKKESAEYIFAYFLIYIFICIHKILRIRRGRDQLNHPVISPSDSSE